jgi:ABC-2 type transport system permease protein
MSTRVLVADDQPLVRVGLTKILEARSDFEVAAAILWASGVAMRLRTMQAGPVMQMPVFLVLFFAPVYVPLSLLRGWIHAVAVVNPLTRVLEAGRGFLAGTPTEVGAAFGAAAGLALLFSWWALRGLRKAEAAG